MGPVAQLVFKTSAVVQPTARSVRLRRRSVAQKKRSSLQARLASGRCRQQRLRLANVPSGADRTIEVESTPYLSLIVTEQARICLIGRRSHLRVQFGGALELTPADSVGGLDPPG